LGGVGVVSQKSDLLTKIVFSIESFYWFKHGEV
jgi:hypothetical protein